MIRDADAMFGKVLNSCFHIDKKLFESIFRRRGHVALSSFFYWISKSADGPAYFLLGFLLLILQAPGAHAVCFTLAVGFALEMPVYKGLKYWFKRSRPFVNIPGVEYAVKPPDRYSFPSGHTAGAFMVASIVSGFFPTLRLPFYLWASAVGYSRVYNGVHYPVDVFAGVALGFMCAQLPMQLLNVIPF